MEANKNGVVSDDHKLGLLIPDEMNQVMIDSGNLMTNETLKRKVSMIANEEVSIIKY